MQEGKTSSKASMQWWDESLSWSWAEDLKIDGLFSLEDLDCVFWPDFLLLWACWEGKNTFL